jgi:hypothetical protein
MPANKFACKNILTNILTNGNNEYIFISSRKRGDKKWIKKKVKKSVVVAEKSANAEKTVNAVKTASVVVVKNKWVDQKLSVAIAARLNVNVLSLKVLLRRAFLAWILDQTNLQPLNYTMLTD